MRRLLAGVLAAALLLAGCGQGTPAAKPGPSDAAAVLDVLKARGLPIGEVVAYTSETDVNKLLGRPGGYASKASWRDPRARPDEGFGVGGGGSIEMYPDAAGAQRRGEYVRTIAESVPMLSEYTWTQGRIVLRVSRDLTPDQAEQYHAALAELPG